ncbi:MAG: DoxX family membrane protein [Acidobacteria bacterium ACB1]|nr:DoxX family membrane protein [Acidobacteria bacterium ACB1]RIJ95241.1 MAG: DoxX family protein [Acidobacteriota bacterium]
MRSVSRVVFALTLIGLGVIGLVKGDFGPGWEPVPESIPARQILAYLSDIVYLACGVGLLLQPTTKLAAHVLFIGVLLWLLVLRLPWLVVDPQVNTWWPASSTSIILAAAWMIYASLADDQDGHSPSFFAGGTGVRIGRIMFGLGLIPLGLAHFLYLEATAPLVPAWLIWPVFWSYFTGAAFIAAGLGVIFGILPRLAAALVTLQLFLLTFVVWTPRIIAGTMSAFQWNEFVVSILLTACACVVAESYSETPWFGVGPLKQA